MSWASTASHSSSAQNSSKKPINKVIGKQESNQHQAELTKIKQMLEMVVAENRELKAELARLKGRENTAKAALVLQGPTKPHALPRNSGETNTLSFSQDPLAVDSSGDEMEASEPQSPSTKRKAENSATDAVKLAKRTGKEKAEPYQHFVEELSQVLTTKFEAMFSKFAEGINAQITALNARVMAVEAISPSPRPTGVGGGAGPMKTAKPYARPVSSESTKTSLENAHIKKYGTE